MISNKEKLSTGTNTWRGNKSEQKTIEYPNTSVRDKQESCKLICILSAHLYRLSSEVPMIEPAIKKSISH